MGTREAVIVAAVRTPAGGRNEQLAHRHPFVEQRRPAFVGR